MPSILAIMGNQLSQFHFKFSFPIKLGLFYQQLASKFKIKLIFCQKVKRIIELSTNKKEKQSPNFYIKLYLYSVISTSPYIILFNII